MGVSALWTQLDAVVQTLKSHTACKQNQRVDGMTQGSRTRCQIQQKKRRQQIDRLQKKRDLCKRMPIIQSSTTTGRVRGQKEMGREVSDTDLSEGEERSPGAGNCGVLTPPTDSETKGHQRREEKEQEDSGKFKVTYLTTFIHRNQVLFSRGLFSIVAFVHQVNLIKVRC